MTTSTITPELKEKISARWGEFIYATYPFDTTGFLRSRKNEFSNPVGHATEKAVTLMVAAICGDDMVDGEVESALADLIRVRAIQQFTPEQATGIIFCVKPILREEILPMYAGQEGFANYLAMESRVDSLCLMAFRMYSEDRERMHMLKVDEYKRRYTQIIRRAEMIVDRPAGEPE